MNINVQRLVVQIVKNDRVIFNKRLIQASLIASFGMSEMAGKYCDEDKTGCADLMNTQNVLPCHFLVSKIVPRLCRRIIHKFDLANIYYTS